MNLLQRFRSASKEAKATFYFLMCSFLQKGIAFITTPIFTRLLTTDEYGQYNVFLSWFSIATLILQLNLCAGIFMQGLVKFQEKMDEFSSSFQGLAFVLTFFWTAVYFLFRSVLNSMLGLDTIQMILMITLTWTSCIFGFWSARQRVEYKYKALVIITVISTTLKPLLSIILVRVMTDHVTGRILGTVIIETILYGWMFFSNIKNIHFLFIWKYWKYGLLFNIVLLPHYLSKIVLNTSDRIMISRMVSDSASGIYSLAYSAGTVMTLLCIAIMNAISPTIYEKIRDNKIQKVTKISNFCLAAIALLNIILIGFVPECIRILGPESYQEAIWVIPPIAFSTFFLFSYEFFSTLEFYYEKTKFITLTSIISAILNVVLNYIFIGIFGYAAAGYTTLVCYVTYALGHYIVANSLSKMNHDGIRAFDGRTIMTISIVMVVLGNALMLLYNIPVARYLVISVLLSILLFKRNTVIKYAKSLF